MTLTTNDPDGPCTPASDQTVLTIDPLPVISIVGGSPACSPDLLTYTIDLTSDGDAITTTAGTVTDNGGGSFDLIVLLTQFFDADDGRQGLGCL